MPLEKLDVEIDDNDDDDVVVFEMGFVTGGDAPIRDSTISIRSRTRPALKEVPIVLLPNTAGAIMHKRDVIQKRR